MSNEDIHAYATTRTHGERKFGEIIYADSRQQAEEICEASGVELEGEIIETELCITPSDILEFIMSNSLITASVEEDMTIIRVTDNSTEQLGAFLNNPLVHYEQE